MKILEIIPMFFRGLYILCHVTSHMLWFAATTSNEEFRRDLDDLG